LPANSSSYFPSIPFFSLLSTPPTSFTQILSHSPQLPIPYMSNKYAVMSIQCRSGEDEEDSVYLNYEEKKLYIYEEGVSNKGGEFIGNRNRVSHRVIGNRNMRFEI